MSKQDQRKERATLMKAAVREDIERGLDSGKLEGKPKEIINEIINKKSARTRKETLNRAEEKFRKNPKLFPKNKPIKVLTEKGFETVNFMKKNDGGMAKKTRVF